MKKLLHILICLTACMVISAAFPQFCYAVNDNSNKDNGINVIDNIDLLSDSEEQKLNSKISSIEKKYNINIIFYITDDKVNDITIDDYVENIYNDHVGIHNDGYMFTISVMTNDRMYDLRSFGSYDKQQRFVNNYDNIETNAVKYLKKEKYNKAFTVFLENVETLENNKSVHEKKEIKFFEGLIAVIIAIAVFLIKYFTIIAQYGKEGKKNPYAFKERGNVKLTESDDQFVTTHTATTIISRSSSSGHSRGSSSSSRRSSGGSGHF